jgi:hypothetical protein
VACNIWCGPLTFVSKFMQRDQLSAGVPITVGEQGPISTTAYLAVATAALAAPATSSTCLSVDAVYSTLPAASAPSPAQRMADLDLEAEMRLPASAVFVDWSQQSTNMCSSMAFMNACALINALKYPSASAAALSAAQLSATFAYYNQRVEECSIKGPASVCKCPDTGACAPPCLDCGSYLNAAAATYGIGVAPRSVTPLQNTVALMNMPPSAAADRIAAQWRVGDTVCVPIDSTNWAANVAAFKAFLHLRAPLAVFLNIAPAQERWMASQVYPAEIPESVRAVVMPPHGALAEGDVGHVVCCVGVMDGLVYFRNSFGLSWGAGGRFALPVSAMCHPQVQAATAIIGTVLPAETVATLT